MGHDLSTEQDTTTTPTLSEVMGTLDELAAAARTNDVDRYRAALLVAKVQALDVEQVRDAYRWGRRLQDMATFDWRGLTGNDPTADIPRAQPGRPER